jgi:hypothetical protein
LQYAGAVKMHTCTNDGADMHYVYGFCSVSLGCCCCCGVPARLPISKNV